MISQKEYATQTPTRVPGDLLPYSRVLVPFDGTQLAEEAMPLAIKLAQQARGNSAVILLRVCQTEWILSSRGGPVAVPTRVPVEIDASLARLEEAIRAQGISVEVTHTAGDAACGLVDIVHEYQAHLLIMVTHASEGMSRLIPGSVAERLLQAAVIPILLLKQGEGAVLRIGDIPHLVMCP